MALIHSLEKEGNFLFKYRGQIPVILFVAAIPVIYFTPIDWMSDNYKMVWTIAAIALSVFGFVFRAYAIGTTPKGTSGRNTKKQVADVLNSTGIYSIVRHPLYVGNYFMWIGIVAYTFNIYYVIIVTLAYWLYYERIMFAEERYLESKFGEDYLSWSLKAPAFIPSFKNYIPSSTPFSMRTVLRREYAGVLATVIGFVFVEVARVYFHETVFEFPDFHMKFLAGTVVVTLILRSLKKYTSVLKDKERD